MGFFQNILMWIGTSFTAEVYMVSTKIQGILWSMADIVLVFVLLKIASVVRIGIKKKIVFRYLFLWFSGILTPLLLFTQTGTQFLILESIICGTQFTILVYTIIVEREGMMSFVRVRIGQ